MGSLMGLIPPKIMGFSLVLIAAAGVIGFMWYKNLSQSVELAKKDTQIVELQASLQMRRMEARNLQASIERQNKAVESLQVESNAANRKAEAAEIEIIDTKADLMEEIAVLEQVPGNDCADGIRLLNDELGL